MKTFVFFTCCGLEDPCGLGRNFPFAKYLVRQGFAVKFLALHPDIQSVKERKQSISGVEVHFVGQMHVIKRGDRKYDFNKAHLLWISLSSSLKMAWAGFWTKSDILYCFQPQPINGFAVLLVKFLTGRTFFLDCQDYEADVNRLTPFQKWLFTLFEDKWLPRAARRISYHTEFLKERYLRLGYPPEKFIYVPNGVDVQRFAAPDEQIVAQLRQKYKLQNKKVVLYFGSLSLKSGHNVDLLLEAFVIVKEQIPESVLLLVGGGENIDDLKAMVDPAVKQDVIFTGRVQPPEIVNYVSLAQVSVDPLKDTPANRGRSPLKNFESMAVGVPVITSDIGDRKRVIETDRAGLLVKLGDARDLARRIVTVLGDESLARRMSTECRRIIQKYFWHTIIDEFVKKIPELKT